jgi:hypothetical protein
MCMLPQARLVAQPEPARPAAHHLSPPQRQQLALDALAGHPVSALAEEHQVSRKFVYQQLHQAHDALNQVFSPAATDQDTVLFSLPVTKDWLEQFVLGLVLIGHSSLRGVTEVLTDLFDYPLSLGSVHNILQQAVTTASHINGQEDLSRIAIGAHDEIFQGRQPVLVGADVASTYCYLLSLEEHRDADTWGVRLLELVERGFQPHATIADFARGLRAAQAEVLPEVPCRGDVFHVLDEAVTLVTSLENRAYEAIAACAELEQQQAHHERRLGRKAADVSAKLRYAQPVAACAVTLADDVALLIRWLREDILAVAGPDHATRVALYDWVVAELRAREAQGSQRLRPLRTLLANQRQALLAFAAALDQNLAALAEEFAVPLAAVRSILQLQALPGVDPQRWQRQAVLWQQLGARYWPLHKAVAATAAGVVRASSVIENLNSRLRNYFFLRRQLGPGYLVLLQFYLNHRRFLRSEHPERVGKSPAELLTGEPHPHWLELLGHTRFSRN